MTRREKRLWILSAALVALIYSTLYVVRGPVELLRQRGLLTATVATVFVAVAAVLLWAVRRRRPGRRELLVLAVFAVLLLALLWRTERPEERLHLLEYGLLGGLVYSALVERRRSRAGTTPVGIGVALTAVALAGLAGWLDEGIQYLLPNRVYDLRDVALNLVAAALAVGALHAAELARRADKG